MHQRCDGTESERGVDWLRLWWDFVSADAVIEFSDCIGLWDDTNPHTWDGNDPTATTADDPYETFVQAAFASGISVPFVVDASTNGVFE